MPSVLRGYRLWLLAGLIAWLLLASGGMLYAQMRHLSVWPVIVTWDEIAAAGLLLPKVLHIAFLGMAALRDPSEAGSRRTGDALGAAALVGLVVFGLDLTARAAFGLGWKPF